ncbi:MAG: GNAT family N-acetyltransferase [Geminicoccaceae bacterium]
MITGSRFHLRTIMEKDLDDLVVLLGDVSGQGDFLPVRLVSQSHLRETFDKDGFWTGNAKRLIMVDGDERIIGIIWIFRAVPYFDALELGYTLFAREHWGKGLTTEAVGLVVDYLFLSEPVNRLEIRCDVENRASARVAEKLGFTHEGIARQATFSRGRHHDMHQFALLRADWLPPPEQRGAAAEPVSV